MKAAGVLATNGGGPVTAVISRLVRPGKEAPFEEWLHGISQEALKFPGHRGVTIFRPRDVAHPEYLLIIHFESAAHLAGWTESEIRRQWLAKSDELTLGATRLHVLTGMENWFTLPGSAAPLPPPRWKTAVVTFLAIYPLVNLISLALFPVVGDWPMPVRSLFMSVIMVSLMTWFVMPRMTRLFYQWLYPG